MMSFRRKLCCRPLLTANSVVVVCGSVFAIHEENARVGEKRSLCTIMFVVVVVGGDLEGDTVALV